VAIVSDRVREESYAEAFLFDLENVRSIRATPGFGQAAGPEGLAEGRVRTPSRLAHVFFRFPSFLRGFLRHGRAAGLGAAHTACGPPLEDRGAVIGVDREREGV